MELVLNLALQGLIHGAIYALTAVGLAMVYGLLRILHIAHTGLFTLGGYLALLVTNATGSLPAALLATALATGVMGVAIYRLCYAPIISQPPFVVLIASIGLLIAMQEVFRIIFGPYGLSYLEAPLRGRIGFGGFAVNMAELSVVPLAALIFLALGAFAKFTRFGIACRATVSDPRMAASYGISVERVRDFTFFFGSALAGIAGAMVGILDNVVEPGMGNVPSYKSLAVIVLGGFGDVRGTLVAALFLGLIESFGTIYLGNVLDRDAIAFIVMIAVLLLRPRGLMAG